MAIFDVKRSIRSAQLRRASSRLVAVQHIRKMRGNNQAHLMRASDGQFYVVKFQNNPCHPRVLVNEFLATRIGRWLGLPMPHIDVIEVPECLLAGTPALKIEIGENLIPCSSGLQVASRYVVNPQTHQIFDDLPESAFARIVNREDLVRVLAFDKWVGNCDSRQAVFTRKIGESRLRVTFVDQGDCFNGGRWTFPDLVHMGIYGHHHVYRDVNGWNSFEPVLSRIEAIGCRDLRKIVSEIPGEWYQYDNQAICRLMETLYKRRTMARHLISRLCDCKRHCFSTG